MSNIIKCDAEKNQFIGEKVGTVSITMYKDSNTTKPFFYIQTDNEDVLPLSYIIEDTLYYY